MDYSDFASLNLTCIVVTEALVEVLRVPCHFQSSHLNLISLELKPYKLNQGSYSFKFELYHNSKV